ncbi:hypothetical protein Afil01_22520 [Actinorhabdospora filicis]|uniref:DUF5667 domain-containing protein n=1 Tax=Actinorhabdospora filicis TaxID=1785913 RepID=A0A9W6SK77_9ACTN|nr:DUF5667 domain-containing protein [Actinorhabdospora filicis]GLZ77445.1 hypothetical protein Afil01_22520 [Actinorhabdospora filicis]
MAELSELMAPRAEFKAALRQRLLAVAAVQGIGDTAETTTEKTERPTRPPWRGRRLIVALGIVVGILTLSGVSAASGEAMPGDPLYDVKRSTEAAQLALAGSDVNRGQLLLEFARNRLTEASAVASDPAAVDSTLDDMDEETTQGVALLTGAAVDRTDDGVLDAVDSFVTTQRADLVDFVASTAADSRVRGLESLKLLDQVQERSEKLRFSLLCTASGDARMDLLGPIPLPCSAAPDPGAHEPDPVATDPQASRDSRPGTDPESSPSSTPPGGKDDTGHGPKGPLVSPSLTPSQTPSETSGNNGGLLGTLGGILSGLLGG